ncbi:toprim domain-containing protein [bacterium]|nr:toprim domain-containing protein [bacterium]
MSKTYQDYGIDLPMDATGQHYTTCPKCSQERKKTMVKCLGIDADKQIWHCNHCGWSGSLNHKAESKPVKPYNQSNIEARARQYKDYLITNFDELQAAGKIPMSWTLKAVEDTYTGYDKTKDCLVFIHCNLSGKPINIKWHKYGNEKKFTQEGQSKCKLFPLNLIPRYDKDPFIVFCEGEKDYVSLLSMGVNAVTGTTGAESIPKDLTPLKDFKQIYIVYDNDPAGYDGAEKLARTLKDTFPDQKVYTYEWHIKTKPGFDVTDYFSNGGTVKGFSHMMDYATPYQDTFISDESYIKLYRKSINSRVFVDPFLYQLWSWCLLKASHKRTIVNAKCNKGNKQITLDKGQFLFNPTKAELEIKQPKSTTRDRLKKLVNIGNILTEKVNDRLLITICKWRFYQ